MKNLSGRFLLRIEPALHRRLRTEANARETSLNQLCAGYLLNGLRPAATDQTYVPLTTAATRLFGESLEGVVLFGSEVRGEAWGESDIDLLIVLSEETKVTRELYSRWERDLETGSRGIWRRVSPQIVALPRSARDAGGLWLVVAVDGLVLSDTHGEVARLLRGLRLEMAEGRARRKLARGRTYWVRDALGKDAAP